MIPKIIYPDSFDFGMPAASLIEMTGKGPDRGYMQKRAALFDNDLDCFERKKGYSYIHLITTGAAERYGSNNNGDSFTKEARLHKAPHPKDPNVAAVMLDGGLKKYHNDTFEKMGAVYRSHVNKHKDGKPSGYIVKAAYNDDMDRGELIVGVDNHIWEKDLQKMANEQPIYFSVAADVPHDYCSYCLSKHHRRSDYCDHLKNHMLAISKEGHQISAINDTPLFHDISGVVRPADKLAFGLRKVASGTLSGADLAELEGMVPDIRTINYYESRRSPSRMELLRKLASIEKKIAAQSCGGPLKDVQLAFSSGSGFGEVDKDLIDKMRNVEPQVLFGELKNRKIVLPVDVFFKLLLGSGFASVEDDMSSVKTELPGIFGRLLEDGESMGSFISDGSYEPASGSCGLNSSDISRLVDSSSLEERPVEIRIIRCVARGGSAPGYALEKSSALRTPVSGFLAREYAKYIAAFADGMPGNVQDLTVAQMWTIGNR